MLVVNEDGNNSAEDNVVTISCQVDPVPVATVPAAAAAAAATSVGSHKIKDSDPLVLHVLPSAVTAECEYMLAMCSVHTYIFCMTIENMNCNTIIQ